MVGQDSTDLRRMALFALYIQYIVNPRLLSLSGLTLLLTSSDMDPACEASLIVLANVVGLVTLTELRQCNLDERCHGMVWVSIQ